MIIWLSTFVLVVTVSLILARFASSWGLLAHPGEHRRHQMATPMVGGIAIFIGIAVAAWLANSALLNWLPVLLLICVVGVLDDRFHLPSWLRLLAQSLAAWLMIQTTGIQLETLGQLVGEDELLLGRWGVPLTIFATVGVINALNMSDGMDGLAGMISVLVLLGISFISNGQLKYPALLVAAVAGFLVLNLRVARAQARIFMGDAGSTMMGLILAFSLILLCQPPHAYAPAVTALWLLGLPLIDAVAVLLMRPLYGQSPFAADRIHYHHLLLTRGIGVNQTLLIIGLVQIMLMAAGIWMWANQVAQTLQFSLFLILFVSYFAVLWGFIRRD